MSEQNTTINLPEDVMKTINEAKSLIEEQKTAKQIEESFSKLQQEYTADETKKVLWDSGFGQIMSENKDRLNDEKFVGTVLQLHASQIKSKLEAEKQTPTQAATQAATQQPAVQQTSQPALNQQSGTPQPTKEINMGSMDVFNDEVINDPKLDHGISMFLKANKPKNTPIYY